MCTAVTYKTKDHYFGRNLDLEYSYNETVTITPRNYVFKFRKMGKMENHFALIGMAYVVDGYPLYDRYIEGGHGHTVFFFNKKAPMLGWRAEEQRQFFHLRGKPITTEI